MNIKEIVSYTYEKIKVKNYEILDAQILVGHYLNKNRVYLFTNPEKEVLREEEEKIKKGILDLENNIPFHYVIGHKEWMGLEFKVNEHTLIPREDTRILYEEVRKIISNNYFNKCRVLEIGLGTGILSITLKNNFKFSTFVGVEINPEALEVCKENISNNNVAIKTYCGDKFQPIIDNKEEKFQILLSNPPYINFEDYENLEKSVKKEPYCALVGGKDGLDFYRYFRDNIHLVLEVGGYLALEFGHEDLENIKDIFREAKKNRFEIINSAQDDGNRDRVIILRYEGNGN